MFLRFWWNQGAAGVRGFSNALVGGSRKVAGRRRKSANRVIEVLIIARCLMISLILERLVRLLSGRALTANLAHC